MQFKWTGRVLGVAWVILGAMAGGAQAQGTGDNGQAPCPFNLEVPCESSHGSAQGDMELGSTCLCGPGFWVRLLPVTTVLPTQPVAIISQPVVVNNTRWLVTQESYAEPGMAEVHIAGYGASHFWSAGSLTRSAAARYSVVTREIWQGAGVPCPRPVTLAASGGGGLSLVLTCSAALGCGASATAGISGACASIGNASAFLDDKKVSGTVSYNAAGSSTDIRGSFGVEVDDSSATVEGRISRDHEWSVRGSGNASGAATYRVRDDRAYCAFTNKAITRRANGVAMAAAGATVDDNGSASFDARAFVDLIVN